MGRFEILKTKNIITSSIEVVTELDKNVMISINAITKKLGQYKAITVCEVNGCYKIVDGNKYFKSLKRNGEKKILCYNLGKLEHGEYEFYRVALNVHQSRLDYLGIAEVISYLNKNEYTSNTIANRTGLDLENVERYATLLDFDWNEFNKKQFNSQINPFENER
jgi:hypothetical protein